MPDDQTTKQVNDMNRNPDGNGGFGEHPENRSDGRWNKDNSFSYWLNYFKNLTVAEFKDWENKTPEDQRSVAAALAYSRVYAARSADGLKDFNAVADRTEGKPVQLIKFSKAEGEEDLEKLAKDFINDPDNLPDHSTGVEAEPEEEVTPTP
jgi:hypothetical protein